MDDVAKVTDALGQDHEALAALCRIAGSNVIIPRPRHEALMAALAALEQCVDDFGETGQCVCQYAKEQAIAALAKVSAAGIGREEKT